jgi:hypothetical protein
MSPSGLVIMRLVYPEPAPVLAVCTKLAPTKRSLAFVVVAAPLFAKVLFPWAAAATSNGLDGSTPLYSAIRISGDFAATVNVIVTTLALAAAGRMFLA